MRFSNPQDAHFKIRETLVNRLQIGAKFQKAP
jgi:hypothetical protein